METMFSAGELAKYQNISKQTLLYYDKIGLFQPSYTDPKNGYRYYSAEQLDYLDTILIMKKIGFSLNEIKEHMASYTTKNSLAFLRQQLRVIEHKISELSLIKNRLEHRCEQVEQAVARPQTVPMLARTEPICILYHEVEKPYSMTEISLATKKSYAQALRDDLPIFFQCGVCVPLEHIYTNRCTQATLAFVTTDPATCAENIRQLPAGLTASTYHIGKYDAIEGAYLRLLEFCREKRLHIVSDSYEFCINDYITSRNEDEFVTKIMFYVEDDSSEG